MTSSTPVLGEPRRERAISVIYQPATERQRHCFHARAADRYDALIHIDHSTALKPLRPGSTWSAGTTPETYPSGL